MTNIVALFMLLTPGLIAVRILWKGREIERSKLFGFVSDYVVCSFLVQMMTYGVMWITYPERTVSFSTNVLAVSNITGAGFVFKYSAVSFAYAIVLPITLPIFLRSWQITEDKINEDAEETEAETDDDSKSEIEAVK